jgi:hypothetical protein
VEKGGVSVSPKSVRKKKGDEKGDKFQSRLSDRVGLNGVEGIYVAAPASYIKNPIRRCID